MPANTADLVSRLADALHAEVVETHISWVLLSPQLAYKLKKPVALPFVDYSTLERRRHFCEEEVRLNRRLAGSLYLGVSRITGPRAQPRFDGAGPVLEYAVRMRRFPPGALFSEQLAAGTLSGDAVDRFAARLADFHADAPRANPLQQAQAGGRQQTLLAALDGAAAVMAPKDATELRAWIVRECARLHPLWLQRRASGGVRECHGDLHLANVISLEGEVLAFDCIEFDPALRWIDVIDDTAFALMDFSARGRPDLGWRFLNAWLDRSGEHEALPALRLCVVGRALVRAQVEHMRSPHSEASRRYARTALAWRRAWDPRLLITHGLPGSGKTFVSQRLLQEQGAVRLRSDVERKRLFGLQALDSSREAGTDLYTAQATQQTYERLFALARIGLQSGWPVVLDAAFLRREERQQALALARELDVRFRIVACEAPLQMLRDRIAARHGDASEADLAVLERLRLAAEPLSAEELPFV